MTFNSVGGNDFKATALGRLIRQFGLDTAQLRFAQRDSACAFELVGGGRRYAESGAVAFTKPLSAMPTGTDVNSATADIQ
jgi:hypothetical protein